MKANTSCIEICQNTHHVTLTSPTALPNACGFLWNSDMMIQMNCRGYAIAQHMQPEPAKYSRGPCLEAATFMQPEHHYYTDHPGRFFYVKVHGSELFSLPYEPVRAPLDVFRFTHLQDELQWHIEKNGLLFNLTLSLGEGAQEQWSLTVTNTNEAPIAFDIYPAFIIGYMSWMNQSAYYDETRNAIIAKCITPYQKSDDYQRIAALKDMTYFISSEKPNSHTCNFRSFVGEGHLHAPIGVTNERLANDAANYEVPIGAFQYKCELQGRQSKEFTWAFGAANRIEDIDFEMATKRTDLARSKKLTPAVTIKSTDPELDNLVNCWLPRQLRYHGQMHRLTTDPQTRNFLQDSMGLVYLDSVLAKQHFITALSQQNASGSMPDGILLHKDAQLKYINQIPHSDHNIWLVWFVDVYLNETGDRELFSQRLPYKDSDAQDTVYTHLTLAMESLRNNLDHRGLSLIKEGDWCDPMNRVGIKGKGVSAWLSIATCGAFSKWAEICELLGYQQDALTWKQHAKTLHEAIETYFWADSWYARGITDDGRLFGTERDEEGKIYINPQAWAMMSLPLSQTRIEGLKYAVNAHLMTPYGPMMLAPAYTEFQKDIGRLTQKSPGVAENGAIYNHAAAFYAAGLYHVNQGDAAFNVLKKMIPSVEDAQIRGQLPVYLPNYYRGAYYQFPDMAGRSSHLFNTGTVAWYYHCIIDGMLGLRGSSEGLMLKPNIPSCFDNLKVTRTFRGHTYKLHYKRVPDTEQTYWSVGGQTFSFSQPLAETKDIIEVFYHA